MIVLTIVLLVSLVSLRVATSAAPWRMLPAPRMKSLLRHPALQSLLARLLGLYLYFTLRTTRWAVDGQEELTALAGGRPTVIAFWHENLPLIPALAMLTWREPNYRPTPAHALVSRHRDGRFIGQVIRRFGLDTVLGSSSRGGPAAVRNLMDLLAKGDIIAITPDGPRGPRRQSAPGVAQLAALAVVPVVPVAARTSRRIQLNTWDRMAIPLPFSRGIMVCGSAIQVPRAGWRETIPVISAALDAVTERAERLCRV
jgi:lysophospholipid acyltransferase (LPLAT)-like uncharacterized protein